jgi:hypothetical protein
MVLFSEDRRLSLLYRAGPSINEYYESRVVPLLRAHPVIPKTVHKGLLRSSGKAVTEHELEEMKAKHLKPIELDVPADTFIS